MEDSLFGSWIEKSLNRGYELCRRGRDHHLDNVATRNSPIGRSKDATHGFAPVNTEQRDSAKQSETEREAGSSITTPTSVVIPPSRGCGGHRRQQSSDPARRDQQHGLRNLIDIHWVEFDKRQSVSTHEQFEKWAESLVTSDTNLRQKRRA